jgi:hypothetical protein
MVKRDRERERRERERRESVCVCEREREREKERDRRQLPRDFDSIPRGDLVENFFFGSRAYKINNYIILIMELYYELYRTSVLIAEPINII